MNKYLVVLLAVVALSVVLVGGATVVRAGGHDRGQGHEFASSAKDKVASFFGITHREPSEADAQDRDEKKRDHLTNRLNAAAADGVITQDEADAIQLWIDGKPESLSSIGHHGLRRAAHNGEIDTFLAGLVSDETITQAEADEIQTWVGARPGALDEIRSQHKRQRGGCGNKSGGGHHGGESPTPPPGDISFISA